MSNEPIAPRPRPAPIDVRDLVEVPLHQYFLLGDGVSANIFRRTDAQAMVPVAGITVLPEAGIDRSRVAQEFCRALDRQYIAAARERARQEADGA